MQYVVGVDLGGTKMVSSVLDEQNNILSRNKKKTKGQEGNKAILDRLSDCIDDSISSAGLKRKDIKGVCIAVPGTIDRIHGILRYTPNLGFENYPIREKIFEKLGINVLLENDVNAGTYGEFRNGAAKGFSDIVGVFPGTGIGSGIIIGGKLHIGHSGSAGEFGHMIIQLDGPVCGCGQYGCVEAIASRTAMTKDAVAAVASGRAGKMYETAGTDFKNYKSSVFLEGYKKGVPEFINIIDRAARNIGIAMANVVNFLSPEVFVLGGGLVEKLGKPFLDSIDASMRHHAMDYMVSDVKVKEAKLGDDAVLYGCAYLVREGL